MPLLILLVWTALESLKLSPSWHCTALGRRVQKERIHHRTLPHLSHLYGRCEAGPVLCEQEGERGCHIIMKRRRGARKERNIILYSI